MHGGWGLDHTDQSVGADTQPVNQRNDYLHEVRVLDGQQGPVDLLTDRYRKP